MSDVRDSMSTKVVAMVAMVVLAGAVRGWDCVCNPRECEVLEPSGCPGLGIVVWDPCRCCKVCARTLGEDCGGFRGTCEPGLKCYEGSCTPITQRSDKRTSGTNPEGMVLATLSRDNNVVMRASAASAIRDYIYTRIE